MSDKPFDEMQEALIRNQFRQMYYDIGFNQCLIVLQEIIVTAAILAEILAEEGPNGKEDKKS